MDDNTIGTCSECGGNLTYVSALNTVMCDNCEYEEEEYY